MLTYAEKRALPALIAQVGVEHPGCTLAQVGNDAVLTISPDADRDKVVALVAGTLCSFVLAAPNDPPQAEATAKFMAEHGGNYRLADALSNFY